MFVSVSEGVKITVLAKYEPEYSLPKEDRHIFSYFVTIENQNEFPVQLLRRKWEIYDTSCEHRMIEGPGVIGKQPVLMGGQSYSYSSASDLYACKGKMKGTSIMKSLVSDDLFEAQVPTFNLEVPHTLN